VSQPEKQPEGAPEAAEATGTAGTGRRDDLVSRPFPPGDWEQPAGQLAALYRRVEEEALRTVAWYLAGRLRKRRLARLLRAGSALSVAVAAALPLLQLAGAGEVGGWGYPALLGAVLCLGADRCFGLTSGWMRELATAQAVQRRLEALRYDWAAERVREVLGPAEGTAGEAAERSLVLLRRCAEDLEELVRAETAGWMMEFRTGGAPPVPPGALPRGGRPDPGPPPARRPPHPGTRPSMPRQRPPEGPR
jgi:hypothetical protein